MPIPAGAAIQAGADVLGMVEGIAQFIGGNNAKRKKEKELAALKRPFYKIQDEYLQNRNLAAGMAGSGLPSATKDMALSEAGRGFGAGVSAVTQGGGDPNLVAKMYDVYERGINKLASDDAEARLNNIKFFMSANKDLAGQKTMQFAINDLQPYEQRVKQLTQDIRAEEKNKWGGIDLAIGSLSNFGGSLDNLLPGGKKTAKSGVGGGAHGGGSPVRDNPHLAVSDIIGDHSQVTDIMESLSPTQRQRLLEFMSMGGETSMR